MEHLLKTGYLCHPQQACTLRKFTLGEGKARGTTVIEVCTAGGLQVDILPDTGLDIGQVRYKGFNVSFISKNGYDSPAAFDPHETEFLHTFPGGMVYTCGLRSTGGAHRDGGEWHPLHGRYHSLCAEQVSADITDDVVIIRGILRETALFGTVLELRRTIRIPVFGAAITIDDKLTNLSHRDEEYTLLYHCNFGWPLLSEQTRLELPQQRRTTPRTPFAASELGQECTFTAPVPNREEQVFFHEDMERTAALVNETIGIRMTMGWSDTLPIFAQWRSLAGGDYVCGLEPSNNYILGRSAERENGTLQVLKPFQTVCTQVSFCFENT